MRGPFIDGIEADLGADLGARFRPISLACAVLVISAGISVPLLQGFITSAEDGILSSVLPAMVYISVLSGLSLLLFLRPWHGKVASIWSASAMLCSLTAVSLCLLVLASQVFSAPHLIEWTYFGIHRTAAEHRMLVEMSYAASLGHFFALISLLLHQVKKEASGTIAQLLSVVVHFSSLLIILEFVYSHRAETGAAFLSATTIFSAVENYALSLGIILAYPHRGPLHLLASTGPSGAMLRRFLPFALIVPAVFGWLEIEGQRLNAHGSAVGTAWLITLIVASLTTVVLLASRTSHRIELDRGYLQLRFRNTLDHMLEGCQIIGFDWRYLYINDAAATHARRRKDELLGRTMQELYPGIESTEMFGALKRCMNEAQPHRMENEFHYPDGGRAWFSLNIEPVPEGVFILSIDTSNERRLIEDLQLHREHLEEAVRRRTQQLEEANRELEAFSYSVSHDLRAPLRHIDGFADLLLRDQNERLDEKGRRFLNNISVAAKEMGTLIGDLLSFSRVGRAEMRRTIVDLDEMVKQAIEAANDDVRPRKIAWIVEPLPQVHADPSMLRLALANLISNAVKYTRTRQDPTVEIGCVTAGNEHMVFVRDNGVGFDMNYSQKLFGVFQRLHGTDEFEGTGIGLANVRRIISRHGGRTWAEGQVDKGATFYFSLPQL